MANLNWRSPIGGTRDLLALVPGLTDKAFRKRQLALGTAIPLGTGNHAEWTAEDVLEAATIQELARLGVLLAEAHRIWLTVREQMVWRQVGAPPSRKAVIMTVGPESGQLVSRGFDEHDEDGPGLDHDGAPSAFVILRIDHLIDRVEARIVAAMDGVS